MESFQFNRTHKIIAVVIVLFVVGCFGFVNWAGSKAAGYVKEKISNQDFVQGNLQVKEVGASYSGGVWLSDITWYDPEGKLVAKIPKITVAVSFSDIFSGNLGGNSIQSIVLEKPELYLSYGEKDGLNVIDLINEKPDQNESKDKSTTTFRGNLEINNALLSIVSGKNKLVFEDFTTVISYKDFPNVVGTLKAKQNKATFSGTLSLVDEKLYVHLDGSAISIKDFFDMVPVESNLTIEEGTVTKLSVDVVLEEDKSMQMTAQGDFEGFKAQAEGIVLDNIKGNLSGNQDELVFNNLTGNFNAQPITLDGKVDIIGEVPKLDLKVASESFQINALSPGFGMSESLSFNANINGTSENPIVKGSFSLPSLRTDQLELVNVSGDFHYNGGSVNLNGNAGVYGGGVSANGIISLADRSFVFDIVGSDLNSTYLTETNLHGPLSFNAHATGVGDPNAAAANGSFYIGSGDFNGVPFNSLTGDFSKVGSSMNFSNIVINTLAGTVSTTATIGTNGKVQFEQVDLQLVSKEALKEQGKAAVEEAIRKETGKLGDSIKKFF